jgi:LEA14-like dessication related protein
MKLIKAIKGISLLILALPFFTSCMHYEEVEIQDIKSIKLLEFSDKGLLVESNVRIHNPNNYDLSVVNSEFDVFIKSSRIGKASIDSKVQIPGESNDYHTIVLRSDYDKLASGALPKLIAITAMGNENIDFKIDGFITGKAFLFKKKVHVSHEGSVPLKLY